MPWLASILLGLAIGAFGLVFGGYMANRAVPWLRISSFEGGSGYFVVAMALLGGLGGTLIGITTCRLAGSPGAAGAARGFGTAIGIVAAIITTLGTLAWAMREQEPLVDGQPINVAVELRLPMGQPRPEAPEGTLNYAALHSGYRTPKSRVAPFRFDEARLEGGHWIVPATVPIHVSEGRRVLSALLPDGETQYFDTPIPARPAALDADWSPWLPSYFGNRALPPEAIAFAIRYRIVQRPAEPPPLQHVPPPEPPSVPRPADDAPTEEWLGVIALAGPYELRRDAAVALTGRPDLAPLLIARISDADPIVARDAMYLVGEMRPPPAEAGDAVRARAADVVRLAVAIDPTAEDSRELLYERVHVLATGVLAAAHGLRRAGVDIRPSLRAMADATRERERAPPRVIADGAERIIAYFDGLDRERSQVRPE